MKNSTSLKPVRGARIRLKYDSMTRGGVKFHKGLMMTIGSASGGFWLYVRVRGRERCLRLKKKDAWEFEVISSPGE